MEWKRKQTEPIGESIKTSEWFCTTRSLHWADSSPLLACVPAGVYKVWVCAGMREPLRRGSGSLAEELILDGTFSPHPLCILLGATDRLADLQPHLTEHCEGI